jgi:hypothetical protein
MITYRHSKMYLSAPLGKPNTNETAKVERDYTKDCTHTIAPAYNKGAYQLISRSDVKHIGR